MNVPLSIDIETDCCCKERGSQMNVMDRFSQMKVMDWFRQHGNICALY